MKKNLLWMIAAILCCGAMTTVFTSCGDDDDDNNTKPDTPEEQQQDNKATKGDVTLTFVAQPKSLQYFEYDFQYVDAKGNSRTIDVDQDTQSSGSLDDFEFEYLTNLISTVAEIPDYEDLKTPFVYRVVLKDQPVGSKVTYTTTCHVKEGTSITETLRYATPTVLSAVMLENGKRVDASAHFSLNTQRVSPEQWQDYISKMEGKNIREASGEITVGN